MSISAKISIIMENHLGVNSISPCPNEEPTLLIQINELSLRQSCSRQTSISETNPNLTQSFDQLSVPKNGHDSKSSEHSQQCDCDACLLGINDEIDSPVKRTKQVNSKFY